MFRGFDHYLSFGSTDQETLRVLEGHYSGLLVPGTIAALQREGTGGFLLSLSAAQAKTAYVIDPRTPLFQQRLASVKKSFAALARILRDETSAVAGIAPAAVDFTHERVARWAGGWVEFNEEYVDTATSKFEKYARKLSQTIRPADAQGPEVIIAPYFVAIDDEWWRVSQRLHTEVAARATSLSVVQAVATTSVAELDRRLADAKGERIAIWVSGFVELAAPVVDLVAYGQAIRAHTAAGLKLFALYGGFFAMMLCDLGLGGLSHGIGYGDSRAWIELPQSGPPAPRFYLPGAHRYAQRELAQRLYSIDATLVACACQVCLGRPPLTLTYHELMQHSVLCRANEMATDARRPRSDVADSLDDYERRLRAAINSNAVSGTPVARKLEELGGHLPRWSEALRRL